jgi:hypothetical protein
MFSWQYFGQKEGLQTPYRPSWIYKLNYVGKIHEVLIRRFNGYSPMDLLKIKEMFLKACSYKLPLDYRNKNARNTIYKYVLFNGLT